MGRRCWEPTAEDRAARDAVAAAFGVSPLELIGHRRAGRVMMARRAAYLVLTERMGLGSEKVGRLMGGRDHSTVLNGLKSAEDWIRRDAEFAETVGKLLEGVAIAPPPPPVKLAPEPIDIARINLIHDIEMAGEPRFRSLPIRRGVRAAIPKEYPLLSGAEIHARRERAREERRERERYWLEREKAAYGLPRAGRALSEMPA